MSLLLRPLLVLLLAVGVAGCGSDTTGSDGDAAEQRTLTVLAASSLTETYGTLKERFERANPGVTVDLVLDSSATLAQMAEQGAPGDVLATADERTMDEAEQKGGTDGEATQFATNVLVLATPSGNDTVTSLEDLSQGDYVVCVDTAPCGAAARTLLDANGVTAEPASEEVDVKAVLQKVASDEADAGLVYRTDAVAAGDQVTTYDIPSADASPNTYWIATTSNAKQKDLAADWVALVTGDEGQKVLADAGFGAPR